MNIWVIISAASLLVSIITLILLKYGLRETNAYTREMLQKYMEFNTKNFVPKSLGDKSEHRGQEYPVKFEELACWDAEIANGVKREKLGLLEALTLPSLCFNSPWERSLDLPRFGYIISISVRIECAYGLDDKTLDSIIANSTITLKGDPGSLILDPVPGSFMRNDKNNMMFSLLNMYGKEDENGAVIPALNYSNLQLRWESKSKMPYTAYFSVRIRLEKRY